MTCVTGLCSDGEPSARNTTTRTSWSTSAEEATDTRSSQWRDLSEDDSESLQSLLDGYYAEFVDTVIGWREKDAEFVRNTEARVYLGAETAEKGLIDTVGRKGRWRIGWPTGSEPTRSRWRHSNPRRAPTDR